MANETTREERSKVLPNDPYDILLDKLIGHPNGAHTTPAVALDRDDYGNTTNYIVQTVRWAGGDTVFLVEITSKGSQRFILQPRVLALIDRQRDTVAKLVRRRHGLRLAEDRKAAGIVPTFTPEQRKKALATRKRNAKARRARREARGAK